ncbi:hypothetical protein MNEG_10189 [Monoraphidium neglectum]|uniref:Uncharacterized protein n=1 Tax=Monoraphidium neglectum TaxID=145388 RepID=A0A0D2M9X6_9CHLO|nr:hypothetical protein MNEG_10189 [Monoraphidium neglectum]KIY97771.1 hypothetical protein MNEG_10189 [Monoraphidium neglectum]|eukprot:XP_013896791.1 hypothetical protein MNEG_10189 [Monoraphidium neglectum]
MATLFERAPALQRLAAKAQELTCDQNFTIVMPKNSSKGGLQAPPLDLIRNPFEDIADVDDDEMRAELNAPRKRTYADALTGKGTRTGPCQGPKGRVRKSKRAKKRAAAKAPLKVAGNCPASVKCKKVTDGNKKAPSEAHSAPTDGNEAQDSPVIGANAKSEPAPHSSRRSSWGSAVSRGSLPRGLSTALVVAARDGGADSEGGSGTPALPARLTEGEAVAIKCGAKAEGADAAEGDGGGSSTVECEAKGQINGAKQTAAVRRKKGRKRVRKVGQHHRS